ncbi:MAG: tetratricopeptide repeat protein, partial [Sedimentisphaerales bacterium]
IYISSYFSNESLSALLMSLTILVAIMILNGNRTSLKLYCVLGFVIGMAFLTKFTVLTILPVVFLVLLYKLFFEEKYSVIVTGRNLSLMFLIIILIAGWFYLRNWMHFGKILVGNWDCALISPLREWWQDPGFHTYKYFCRFGRVFVEPYYVGTYSFFDSIYATFWGDAFIGGMGLYSYRPPWNYEYMSAVYLLAIPAAMAIIIGMICAIGNIIRASDKIWMLILGSIYTVACSIVYMNLLLPYYSSAKAFYGLGAILPISLIFAFGFDCIDNQLKNNKRLFLLRMVLYGWLGTLACAILLSFFITPAQVDAVRYSNLDKLAKQGELAQAVAYYNQFLRNNPEDWYAHYQMAKAYFLQHEYDKAIEHYSQAVQIKPDDPNILNALGGALGQQGRLDEAIVYLHEALQLDPNSAKAHYYFAQVMAKKDKINEAVEHFENAIRLKPDWAEPMNELAWYLAINPKMKADNPDRALRLALQACELTNYKNPELLDTLAVAYAANGNFNKAVETAQKALGLCQSPEQDAVKEQIKNRLDLFKAGKPYIE